MHFKKYYLIQKEAKQRTKDKNQTKYGLIKEVNFITFKKWLKDNDIEMYSKLMKENLLLLKDLLER